MPKKPAATPTPAPEAAIRGAMARVRRTFPAPTGAFGLSMARATSPMATAKKISRAWPSIALATEDPTKAPTDPVPANSKAQGQRTRPARA